MPKYVHVKEIEDGMVLAHPLINNFGQILLPEGARIHSGHKRLLKIWNILTVPVVTDEDKAAMHNLSPEILTMAEEKVRDRLSWEPDNEPEKDMFDTALIIIAKELQKSESKK